MNLCNGTCYCSNYYYWTGATCSPCYSSCISCKGPLLSDCLLNATSSTNCSTGYYYQSSTCGTTTIKNCFACDSSCSTCSGSSSNNCTSCIENATLQSNKTCLCSQGWLGTPPVCNRTYFSASLSVNASDIAKIVFSQPLAQQLTNSNISVTINNVTQSFSITMIDISTYLIQIVFVQNITQNSSLGITFIGSIISQNNSLLSTSNLTVALYARTLGGTQQCFESTFSNCYTCASPMNLCNSICYCNNSFYWNGTTCSACYSSCSICNGPSANDCLLQIISINNVCSDGYFYYSNQCGRNIYKNCFACDPSCFNCMGNASSDCTDCIQNASLQPDNTCLCNQG